jgi:hypothetical protein
MDFMAVVFEQQDEGFANHGLIVHHQNPIGFASFHLERSMKKMVRSLSHERALIVRLSDANSTPIDPGTSSSSFIIVIFMKNGETTLNIR